MGQSSESYVLNAANYSSKAMVIRRINGLRGIWKIRLEPIRPKRSLAQNAWYWSCIVSPFADYLTDQDCEVASLDHAHQIMAEKFLGVDIMAADGTPVGRRIRSTSELSVGEFSDYCMRCRVWLADWFQIRTPSLDDYTGDQEDKDDEADL